MKRVMDYRVQFKEPQYRFYKIRNYKIWIDKKRTEFQPWMDKNIGAENINWKIEVSLRGLIFLYFLRENDMYLFILIYGERLA